MTSPTRGSSVPPRGILVSRQSRPHHFDPDKSSDDFDSESSVLANRRPQNRTSRRSRSIPRKGKGSDSSTSTCAKKTTFHTEVLNLTEGKKTHLSTLNIGVDNASIKSTSSNDISRISFQGKRALFEGVIQKKPNVEANTNKEDNVLIYENMTENNMSEIEERNRKLEQELFRLEQTATLREEVSRRLREKIETMENDIEERQRLWEIEIANYEKDRLHKEKIIT